MTKTKKGDKMVIFRANSFVKYQPSSIGGTRSLPAMPHCLQHLTPCLIKDGRQGLDISQTLCYETPEQFSQNKFFDSIIPSMRTSKITMVIRESKNGQRGLER